MTEKTRDIRELPKTQNIFFLIPVLLGHEDVTNILSFVHVFVRRASEIHDRNIAVNLTFIADPPDKAMEFKKELDMFVSAAAGVKAYSERLDFPMSLGLFVGKGCYGSSLGACIDMLAADAQFTLHRTTFVVADMSLDFFHSNVLEEVIKSVDNWKQRQLLFSRVFVSHGWHSFCEESPCDKSVWWRKKGREFISNLFFKVLRVLRPESRKLPKDTTLSVRAYPGEYFLCESAFDMLEDRSPFETQLILLAYAYNQQSYYPDIRPYEYHQSKSTLRIRDVWNTLKLINEMRRELQAHGNWRGILELRG